MASELVKQALEKLETTMETFADSDVFKTYLRKQAKFHRYSPSNIAWISFQRPDATYVAGFKSWLKLGRCVRKGEKAITILAPAPFKVEDADGNEKMRMWFKTVPVFDVSQTDIIEGHKNPFIPDAIPDWLPSGDTDALDDLVRVVEATGCTIARVPNLGGAGGNYNPSSRHINLVEYESTVAMASVLVHEWAHDVIHRMKLYTYAQEEVVVESIAYIVTEALGIRNENEQSSFIYIAGWMKDDKKSFKSALSLIQKTAHDMIEKIEHGLTS